jgi:hypothetical protein
MIKFNTILGTKHLNMEARNQKHFMQLQLTRMRCSKCVSDTEITFKEITNIGAFPTVKVKYLVPVINACCDEFKNRIEQKLKETAE